MYFLIEYCHEAELAKKAGNVKNVNELSQFCFCLAFFLYPTKAKLKQKRGFSVAVKIQ